MLNVLDLFSGIGGFSVGLEATGKFKTIGFCEQDKFCQRVLRKHWKDIPIYEDIKKLNAKKIKADVVVGGFPCQSISLAGKQKGKNDDRFLFPEMFRIIKEVKPKWIIAENVQNLISISNGQILQGILNDLESENYEVQTFSISAQSQGAWHKRQRVWIVANTNPRLSIRENEQIQTRGNTINSSSKDVSNSKKLRFRGRSSEECRTQQWEFQQKEQKGSEVWSEVERRNSQNRKDVPNSNKQGLERLNEQSASIKTNKKQTNFGSENCSQQSKKTWWQTQSELCGVPNGISYELDKDRVNRIKSLGNSIVPQIITEIGKAIIEVENI